jgi:hypothetical protein
MNERGHLFVATNKWMNDEGQLEWAGIGFNGNHIQSHNSVFVCNNINEFILDVIDEAKGATDYVDGE